MFPLQEVAPALWLIIRRCLPAVVNLGATLRRDKSDLRQEILEAPYVFCAFDQERKNRRRCAASGCWADWTVHAGRLARPRPTASSLPRTARGARRSILADRAARHAGAWLIDRSRVQLASAGMEVGYARAHPEHQILLHEARYSRLRSARRAHVALLILILADIGGKRLHGRARPDQRDRVPRPARQHDRFACFIPPDGGLRRRFSF